MTVLFNSFFSPLSFREGPGVRLLFLLSLFLLASCSGDTPLSDDKGSVEIRFQPSVSVSTQTRLPFDDAQSTPLRAMVFKSLTSGDYIGDAVYEEALTFSGSTALGFSTPQYFPWDDSPVYLCSLSPWDDLWTDWVYDGSTRSTQVSRSLDGKTDLLLASQLSVNKSGALAGGASKLAFKHLLTKLKVRAVADADAPYPPADVWGGITKIELVGVLGQSPSVLATVNLVSGAAVFSPSVWEPPVAFPLYQMSGDDLYPAEDVLFSDLSVPLPVQAADVAYSLIAPFTPTGENDLTLKVYTGHFPQGVEVTASLDSPEPTAGRYCVVTLTFTTGDKPMIQATSEISAWQSGDSMDSVLE